MKFRSFSIPACVLLSATLVGCGFGAVTEASEIIKTQLRSPSSFALISGKEVWSGKTSTGQVAHIVRVEYDAQNGFGATLRACKFVAFRIEGDQVKWKAQGSIATCDSSADYEQATVSGMRKYNFGA